MFKVNLLIPNFFKRLVSETSISTYILFKCIIIILYITLITFSQDSKPVIAVLGLDNNGGVSKTVIDTICNRISFLIEKDQNYYVFQREFIAPLLEESGFAIFDGIYSLREKLISAGTLLSADEIIAGSISRKNGYLSLIINRIDINRKYQLSIQKVSCTVSKRVFLEHELPKVVNSLFLNYHDIKYKDSNDNTVKNNDISNINIEGIQKLNSCAQENRSTQLITKHKNRALWIIFSTIVLAGTAVSAYMYYDNNHLYKGPSSNNVPLDNLPIRIR